MDSFNRIWQRYKTGFGKVDGEHWLGNDNIYAITQQRSYKVFRGQTAYAIYTSFSINNEETNNKLSINGFSGNAANFLQISQEKWRLESKNDAVLIIIISKEFTSLIKNS
ncbi:angiopoietin-2-like [Mytilus galloprovincialis]|uniref:angiopoietin-2-like n=1 Tax=Mytilus galloprovincialis TaxID=29158 RepID=UPI003F7BB806